MKEVRIWNPIGFSLVLAVSFWDPEPARAAGGGAEFEARASARGEQTARLTASAQLGAISLQAGAESAASPNAPLRHAALMGVGFSFDDWQLELSGKLAPPQTGADGYTGELALRREAELGSAALSLSAHGSSWVSCGGCVAEQLNALGAAAELEARLPLSVRGGLRAAVYRVELKAVDANAAPAPGRSNKVYRPGPWDRFGASTLDWPERWEVGAQAARPWGPLSTTLTASVGAPASDGALATRAGLRIEAALGPATAAIAGAVARLTPSGQVLAEIALALGIHLGGVP